MTSVQPADEKQAFQHFDPVDPEVPAIDLDKVGNIVQNASIEAVGGFKMTDEEKKLVRPPRLPSRARHSYAAEPSRESENGSTSSTPHQPHVSVRLA